MVKLINLNVYEAKNVVCGYFIDDVPEGTSFRFGIACDDAERGLMIPRYIVVGVFDDGTTKAAGIFGLDDINGNAEDLFMYDNILSYIDLDTAKAFVRGEIEAGEYENEEQAKSGVLVELINSGVEIFDNAMNYLTNKDK